MSDTPDPLADQHRGPGDFRPSASLETLRLRAELLAELRRFFDEAGYWEVETPLLSHDVVVDAWLEPFVVPRDERNQSQAALYLQTSPEFAMKRLLAAGAQAIYQVTKAFRAHESGRLHNPEFTLVEWYRVADTHHDQMTFVEELVVRFLTKAQNLRETPTRARWSNGVGVPSRPFPRLAYDEAFEKYAGSRVLSLSPPQLASLARVRGIKPPESLSADDRDGWLNLLLAELVEPHLGRDVPTFLFDYPASQAALARTRSSDPPVAERFELYIGGIEICNGYHELTDPQELRERMRRQAAIRARAGLRSLPLQNRLLDAMDAGLPACSGVALGFDRLLMTALGAETIDEVLAFPFDRA
jgi:lysyl-tRNA synthetase class 2